MNFCAFLSNLFKFIHGRGSNQVSRHFNYKKYINQKNYGKLKIKDFYKPKKKSNTGFILSA